MTLKLEATPPAFSLKAQNFSLQMQSYGTCVSWCTLDRANMQIEDDRAVRVQQRAGESDLQAGPISPGPNLDMWDDFSMVCHEKGVLDYLYLPRTISAESFSVAAVVGFRLPPEGMGTIFAVNFGRQSMRAACLGGQFKATQGPDELITDETELAETGLFLVVLSCTENTIRMRVRDLDTVGTINSAELSRPLPPELNVIFSADGILENSEDPFPSAPRSWRGQYFETFCFTSDILTSGNELSLMDSYFDAVYGGGHD